MASPSPAQPPPSPSPPRRGKRSRSPSGERESGAEFDRLLPPPGQPGGNAAPPSRQANLSNSVAGQPISPGNKGNYEFKAGSDVNPRFLNPKDQSTSPGQKGIGLLDSGSNMNLMFSNSKGNKHGPQLFGDQSISPGTNGNSEAKDVSNIMNACFFKDDSIVVHGTKSLFHGDQSISPGPKGGIGLTSGSNLELIFLNSKGNEHDPQFFGDRAISPGKNGNSAFSKDDSADAQGTKSDLSNSTPKSSFLLELTGCQSFTYNQLYYATSGFNEENLMPQFGPSVYQGQLPSGKVLIRVYEKVQEKLQEYKGVLRRFSPSRKHKNLIKLIGSFADEKRLILVYEFPFEVCLRERLNVAPFAGGLGTYARYRIAVELAEALEHIVKQEIPLIPKLFTEDHVFVGSKGNPILIDFIGAAEGVGRTFDSTLEIVLHYGIFLGKLRAVKCANGVEIPIRDEVWEELEKQCIQANRYKRPFPDYIVHVMKSRMKELFSLTSPMHDEFKRKYNLKW